jgi:hypothetical protein
MVEHGYRGAAGGRWASTDVSDYAHTVAGACGAAGTRGRVRPRPPPQRGAQVHQSLGGSTSGRRCAGAAAVQQSESVGVGPAAGGAEAHAARPPHAGSGPAHRRDELPEKGHAFRRRRAVVLGRARAKVPVAVTHAKKHALALEAFDTVLARGVGPSVKGWITALPTAEADRAGPPRIQRRTRPRSLRGALVAQVAP